MRFLMVMGLLALLGCGGEESAPVECGWCYDVELDCSWQSCDLECRDRPVECETNR